MKTAPDLHLAERSRAVFDRATAEARKLRHEYVDTGHLLLGLISDTEGVAIAALRNMGADLAAIRELVLKLVNPGKDSVRSIGELPATSRLKTALDLAASEAKQLGHSYLGTEHLLLGLLAEAHGIGATALGAAGVKLDAARDEIKRILG